MTAFIRSTIVGMALLVGAATAEEVAIPASKDNTLFEDAKGETSNGSGIYLFAGNTNQGQARRTLIAFDIATHVPTDATVTRTSVTLNMSKTTAGSQAVQLHRLLADWGEGSSDAASQEGKGTAADTDDATWLHTFLDTQEWAAPGGDFVGTASASLAVEGVGLYTWESTPSMVADVQGWLDGSLGNFGWILIGNEEEDRTAKRFDSMEHSEVANKPLLTVEFERAPDVVTSVDAKSWGQVKRNSH